MPSLDYRQKRILSVMSQWMWNPSFATLGICCVQFQIVSWQLSPDDQLPGVNLTVAV